MKRAFACNHLRSLRHFCSRSSPAQSSYIRNRHFYVSETLHMGNGLMGTFMSPSLSARFQRTLSTQSGLRTRSDMMEAFRAAATASEALEAFKDLESEFGDNDFVIGDACLKISQFMVREGLDPENVLAVSTRAYDVYDRQNEPSWPLATALLYMASMHYKMENFVEARKCVDRIQRVLDGILRQGSDGEINDRGVRQGMQQQLELAAIDATKMQSVLERFNEAITTMESVLLKDDSEARAYILVARARAFFAQGKVADCQRCLEISSSIFGELKPLIAFQGYLEIGLLYEIMSEVESALYFMKKALSFFDKLPQELQNGVGIVSATIGRILFSSGKVSEAVPYLETAAEHVKVSYGEKDSPLLAIYKFLGLAYMMLERPESAAQVFALAKDMAYAAFGPCYPDSIEILENLANAYSAMGRYELAIEFQQRVIDGWKSHGETAKDKLTEAELFLEEIKSKQNLAPTDFIQPLCDLSFFK